MQLTQQQEEAVRAIMDWHGRSASQIFTLTGYAGTGKTTLAKYIANSISGDVIFMSYTGKAAKVLSEKGCAPSGTIHSFLYKFVKTEGEAPVFKYAPDMKTLRASLIVVDEYSMLNKKLYDDIVRTGCKILFLGDPFQLPPISKDHTTLEPDFVLTEILRQALESPILTAAHAVRRGENIDYGDYGDFKYLRSANLKDIDIDQTQIICGINRTRNKINNYYKPHGLEVGSKVICRQNQPEKSLLNGQMSECIYFSAQSHSTHTVILTPDNSDDYNIDVECFIQPFSDTTYKTPYSKKITRFEHAYAITCHLAQGSEFENVLIQKEFTRYQSEEERRRWLYTAITRASKTCTLVEAILYD